MSKLIFNALSAIFDGSMATKVFAFIESVMMALTAVFPILWLYPMPFL